MIRMSSFEEQFPSLKGLGGIRELTCRPDGIKKSVNNYCEIDIQEQCLDKQRVNDVIQKYLPATLWHGIKKELGLKQLDEAT